MQQNTQEVQNPPVVHETATPSEYRERRVRRVMRDIEREMRRLVDLLVSQSRH